MGYLALLFLVVELIEASLLLRLGHAFGVGPTSAIVVLTALIGAFLAKREGLKVFREWRAALSQMRPPADGLTSGFLVLVGAILLVSPGLIGDVVGLLLLFPPTRRLAAGAIERRLRASPGGFLRTEVHHAVYVRHGGAVPGAASRGSVIEGEVVGVSDQPVDGPAVLLPKTPSTPES